jgi:hypothetical protein
MAGTLKLDGREAEGAEQRCEDASPNYPGLHRKSRKVH